MQPSATAYVVRHVTTYRYSAPMVDGYTLTHLLPRATALQTIRSADIIVTPDPDERDTRLDLFGNLVVQLGMHRPHDSLIVTGYCEVEVTAAALPTVEMSWEDAVVATASVSGRDALDVSPFVPSSPLVDLEPVHRDLHQLTADAFPPGQDLVVGVRDLCHTIFTGFSFDPGFSDVSTPLATVLEARRGVCQDFAHLGVACLRSLGLAARYVSGYIETDAPEGEERLIGADASHAWLSVWVPGWGWLDVDPTNDHVPPDRHVTVAWGRDYADVTPVRGVVIGPAATQELSVSVDMQRLPS